jgi:large exoprotein involved in heme utilization and adhesion
VARARQDYLINRNRMIYEGSSQVNVGTLLASTVNITDSQFSALFKSSLFKMWFSPGGRTVLDFLLS